MGGIERLLLDFAESFAEMESEFKLVVVVMNNKYDPYLRNQLESLCKEVYFLDREEGNTNPKYLLKLFGIVKKHRIDVIHTHDHGSKHFSILCKLLKPALKLIFSVHDKFLFDSVSRLKMRFINELSTKMLLFPDPCCSTARRKGLTKLRSFIMAFDCPVLREVTEHLWRMAFLKLSM